MRASALAANINLKLLYTRLLPGDALPPDVPRSECSKFKCGSGTFRMNVALSELPSFTALPGKDGRSRITAPASSSRPSLAYMDRAYRDARAHGWSREPIIEMLIPSTLDDSLAPPGAHVASLFCQHVAPELPDGRSWDDAREEVADLMIATVDRYAPGFAASVVGRQVLSPLDLERSSAWSAATSFTGRYRSTSCSRRGPCSAMPITAGPIRGLYHCGSGAHPGGGVTGAPGHNAAKASSPDLRPFALSLSGCRAFGSGTHLRHGSRSA